MQECFSSKLHCSGHLVLDQWKLGSPSYKCDYWFDYKWKHANGDVSLLKKGQMLICLWSVFQDIENLALKKKINGLIQKKIKWALGLDAFIEQMMCSPRWSGHIRACYKQWVGSEIKPSCKRKWYFSEISLEHGFWYHSSQNCSKPYEGKAKG